MGTCDPIFTCFEVSENFEKRSCDLLRVCNGQHFVLKGSTCGVMYCMVDQRV